MEIGEEFVVFGWMNVGFDGWFMFGMK